MKLRLLATCLCMVLGACDGRPAERLAGDSAAADLADAEGGSSDGGAAGPARMDGTAPADAAPVADAASVADASALADAATSADAAARADAATTADAGRSWPLGMNDVTILTPLPASLSSPVLLRGTDLAQDGAALVPKDLYDQVGKRVCFSDGPGVCPSEVDVLAAQDYERLHLVAVRFDLCDRNLPGTCAEGEDGRLRLVWQPMRSETFFADAALHAFFSIPNAQLPSALATLRELAELQSTPVNSALMVSPGLTVPGKPKYAEGLRTFVRTYAQRARLVRLTLNAQPVSFGEIRWLMRGIERRADGMLHDIVIPGSSAVQQHVFARGLGFEASPAVDLPEGLTGVLSTSVFNAASSDAQATMLKSLLTTDDPTKAAPDTAPCVACHTSTLLLDTRAPDVDVQQLGGGYITSRDVSIAAGRPSNTGRTLRALGYAARAPVISRRVAHETAQVLTEIEQRFP